MKLLALLLVSVLGGGVFAFEHERTTHLEHRLAAVAQTIAQRPVGVHCQGVAGEMLDVTSEAGTVEFDASGRPADRTELKRGVCVALARFPKDVRTSGFDCMVHDLPCSRRIDEDAFAVHTLAHESWHLRGVLDEAKTECLALQTVGDVSTQLGADLLRAAAITRFSLRHIYPSLPEEYRTSDCHDGGPLDLRPGLSAWPG